jgi:hypothetical protein
VNADVGNLNQPQDKLASLFRSTGAEWVGLVIPCNRKRLRPFL